VLGSRHAIPDPSAATMKIVFVLPSVTAVPVGGFKIVYEYANRLAGRGHRVSIVHAVAGGAGGGLGGRMRHRHLVRRLRREPAAVAPWFDFDAEVELLVAEKLDSDVIGRRNLVIATAWETAAAVAAAVGDAGFYLIQGLETWGDIEQVRATWRLPLRKIVISGWLRDIAVELGEGARTTVVPNGLDLDRLGVDVPLMAREPRVGALLGALKGEADVGAALLTARERLPELRAVTYGVAARPDALPDWVEHVRLPDPRQLRELYNSCSIFLQASAADGWGLSATEAMACGCALVTYDNGGSREYAFDGETAVVVEEGAENIAAAIVALVTDPQRRLMLALQGHEAVSAFTWERAVGSLEDVLGIVPVAGRG
jgi:glycosyltransferase involved in cell wall biosynthesis